MSPDLSPCSFCNFPLFLIVRMRVVLVVVVVGCMQHTNQIMQDIPYFCEGPLQFPPVCSRIFHHTPTGPPGFPFSSTLQWTQSPCRLFKDFSKDLTRLLLLECLSLRGLRKSNMQFKAQNFTKSFWGRNLQTFYLGIWDIYLDDMQLLSMCC